MPLLLDPAPPLLELELELDPPLLEELLDPPLLLELPLLPTPPLLLLTPSGAPTVAPPPPPPHAVRSAKAPKLRHPHASRPIPAEMDRDTVTSFMIRIFIGAGKASKFRRFTTLVGIELRARPHRSLTYHRAWTAAR